MTFVTFSFLFKHTQTFLQSILCSDPKANSDEESKCLECVVILMKALHLQAYSVSDVLALEINTKVN